MGISAEDVLVSYIWHCCFKSHYDELLIYATEVCYGFGIVQKTVLFTLVIIETQKRLL